MQVVISKRRVRAAGAVLIAAALASPAVLADQYDWTNGGPSTNWDAIDPVKGTYGNWQDRQTLPGAADDVVVNYDPSDTSINLNGRRVIGSLSVNLINDSFAITGNPQDSLTLTSGSLSFSPLMRSSTASIAVPVAIGNDAGWLVDSPYGNTPSALILTGGLSDGGGDHWLYKTGNGELRFVGSTVSVGGLSVGAGRVVLQGSTFNARTMNVQSDLRLEGGATVNLSSAATLSMPEYSYPAVGLTIDSSTFGAAGLAGQGTINLRSSETAPAVIHLTLAPDQTTAFTGGINGAGSLIIDGSPTGIQVLTSNQAGTFSGETLIRGGQVQVDKGILQNSAVTVSAGARLAAWNRQEVAVGALAGDGEVNAGSLTVGGNNADSMFSGSLSVGILNKIGSGTLTLAHPGALGNLNIAGGGLSLEPGMWNATNVSVGGTSTPANLSLANGAQIDKPFGSTLITGSSSTVTVSGPGSRLSAQDLAVDGGILRIQGGASVSDSYQPTISSGGAVTVEGLGSRWTTDSWWSAGPVSLARREHLPCATVAWLM